MKDLPKISFTGNPDFFVITDKLNFENKAINRKNRKTKKNFPNKTHLRKPTFPKNLKQNNISK